MKKIFLGISKLIFFPMSVAIRLCVGISLIRLVLIMAIMIGLPVWVIYNNKVDSPSILAASYAAEVVLAVIARYDIKMLNLQSLTSSSMMFKRHGSKRSLSGWGDLQNALVLTSFRAYMAALNFRGINFRSQTDKLKTFTDGVNLGEILCRRSNKDFVIPVMDHRLEAIVIPPADNSCTRYLDEYLVLPTIFQGVIALALLLVDTCVSETEPLITAFCEGFNKDLVESN
jgi:hypothetical protein